MASSINGKFVKFATQLKSKLEQLHDKTIKDGVIFGWARDFQLLSGEFRNNDNRIEKVLNWFCKHAGTNGYKLPVVQSAKHFRNQFLWIEQTMKGQEEYVMNY